MGADAGGPQLAWWLVPSPPWFGHFQSVISALAGRLGGPVFEPHLTLAISHLPGEMAAARGGRQVLEGQDLPALTAALAARLRPVWLTPDGIDHGSAYFQSVFLRMAATAAERALLTAQVAALHETLAHVVPGCTQAPAFSPHLSLCYGELPDTRRQAVAAELAGELAAGPAPCMSDSGQKSCGSGRDAVCFDTLVAVRPHRGAPGFGRVDHWDVFLRVRLADQDLRHHGTSGGALRHGA